MTGQFADPHMYTNHSGGFFEQPQVWAQELVERLDGRASASPSTLIAMLENAEQLTEAFIRQAVVTLAPHLGDKFDACVEGMSVQPKGQEPHIA